MRVRLRASGTSRLLHRIDRADGGDRAPVDPAEPDGWLDELTGLRVPG